MGLLDSIKKLFGGGQAESAPAETMATPEASAAPTMETPADMGGASMGGSGMEAPAAPEGSLDDTLSTD